MEIGWGERRGERAVAPALGPGRKVRAPQDRVLDNVQSGKPEGKCNREQTARDPAAWGAG